MSDTAPSEMTVGELLASSLTRAKISGSSYALYDIKAPGFENYMLRVNRHVHGGLKKWREKLLETSSLTVPDFFFTGPEVSQSLLHFDSNGEDKPIMSIVRKQPGVRLHNYLEDSEKSQELMRALIGNPQTMQDIFEQAAFIGLQHNAQYNPDIHELNILVNEGKNLSVVDIVSQENINRYRKPSKLCEAISREYIENVYNTLLKLSNVQPKNEALSAEFTTLVSALRDKVQASMEDRSLLQAHEEWKGYQRMIPNDTRTLDVDDMRFETATSYDLDDDMDGVIKARTIHAVALSDPPATLKLALDRLYEKAVAQRA